MVSPLIPNPGFGSIQEDSYVSGDHQIQRLQLTLGRSFNEDLLLKCELFRDNYSESKSVKSFYTQGIILALNAKF